MAEEGIGDTDDDVNPEQEQYASRLFEIAQNALRRRKMAQQRKEESEGALKKLRNTAAHLQRQVKEEKSRLFFLSIPLFLALTKDLIIDVLLSFMAVNFVQFFDWPLDIGMAVLFWVWRIEKNVKDRAARTFFVSVCEILIGFVPAWTIRVLLAMAQTYKTVRTKREDLQKVERKIAKLEKSGVRST